ncbi:MAG: hypothetical protein ACM3TN_22225 [Alphaproteobacteria bacterium]
MNNLNIMANGKVRIAVISCLMILVLIVTANVESAQTNKLPGVMTGPAPWLPEIDNLLPRLNAINLPALYQEGNALHIHQHLDILLNGKPVTVPAGIGINQVARFISPLHTHDVSGVIHVESDVKRDFTLGQFFDVWGLRFSKSCVGAYCAKGAEALRVFVNGKLVSGDPRNLVLREHQEIAVVYGPVAANVAVPSTYRFEE